MKRDSAKESEAEEVASDEVVEETPAKEDRGEAAVEQAEAEVVEPTLEEVANEWKERALRATADLENYRKRMAREKTEALRYGTQGLLEQLLPVLDNFEMGLVAAAAEKDSMIYCGMEMVKKQLDEFLTSQGLEEVLAEGQAFDPNVHEAVAQEECADSEEGTILRVIRRGFRMHDRLVRPSNVVVAKALETNQEETASEEGAS